MNIELLVKKATNELELSGIKTAGLDAILLLEKALKQDRAHILTRDLEPITNSEYSKFRKLILRRKKGEPVAYILGHKEFYGYDFLVNKNVLIPRPETELIVDDTINYLRTNRRKNKRTIRIIDIGTGSGCIIISLALEFNKLLTTDSPLPTKYYASDISKKALYVAKKNALIHKVNKIIRFYQSNLFSNPKIPKKYDLIIANLPYVSDKITSRLRSKRANHLSTPLEAGKSPLDSARSGQITNNNRGVFYEPKEAIFAEDRGTNIIKKFIKQAKDKIDIDGLILIEADPRNIKHISIYAKKIFPGSKIEILKDLAKCDRVLKVLT